MISFCDNLFCIKSKTTSIFSQVNFISDKTPRKMKSVFVIFLVFAIALCVQAHGPDRNETAIPPKVLASVVALHKDFMHMLHSGPWDAEQISKDLQNVADVIQAKVFWYQKKFKNLTNEISALEDENVDSQTIKQTIMSWFHFIEAVYPGMRRAIHPGGGPGPNMIPPRPTTTESTNN